MATELLKEKIKGVSYLAVLDEDADGAPVIKVTADGKESFYSPNYSAEELRLALSTEEYSQQKGGKFIDG